MCGTTENICSISYHLKSTEILHGDSSSFLEDSYGPPAETQVRK